MKEYKTQVPVIVPGGCAGDFYGEYMAGGVMILLGLGAGEDKPIAGDYLGTGMHDGVIFLRGEVEKHQLGAEVAVMELDEKSSIWSLPPTDGENKMGVGGVYEGV
ncbi:MAG: hypothetical protein MIO93_09190 [ANME-2 cluster archaeon]|jgi:glutamate synthase domain-containing protein 3|nr:hypothetical protein [ANME-2 cluster archaeon]